MWKDFFYFSRRERQGILILIVLIAGIFIGKFLFTPDKSASSSGIDLITSENKENKEDGSEKTTERPISNPYLSGNKKKSDLSVKPNQPSEKRTYYSSPDKTQSLPKSKKYPTSEKFLPGTILDINTIDTVQLMKIPGIGTAFAKRIVSYRHLLGGYYRLEQLQEVYGMYAELYEKIAPFLRTDTNNITPISVNTTSLDQLKVHPYINFYQAKAIIELRKKKGKLENIHELDLLEEFSPEDLERIKHYLAF